MRRIRTFLLAAVLLSPTISRADFLEDIGLALRASAFTLDSRPNPLSGGRDYFVGRTFVGND
jgi:hypothetical protein